MLLPLKKQSGMLGIFHSNHLENVHEAIEQSSVDLGQIVPGYPRKLLRGIWRVLTQDTSLSVLMQVENDSKLVLLISHDLQP